MVIVKKIPPPPDSDAAGTSDEADDTSGGTTEKKSVLPESVTTFLAALPEGLKVRIANGSSSVTERQGDASYIAFSKVSVRGLMHDKKFSVRTSLQGDAAFPKDFFVSFPCRITAVYNTETGGGTMQTSFSKITSKFFTLHNISLKATLSEDRITVQSANFQSLNKLSDKPLDKSKLNLVYLFDEAALTANAYFENFDPHKVITFTDKLSPLNNITMLRLFGDAAFNYSSEGLQYQTDLVGTTPPASAGGEGGFTVALSGTDHAVVFKEVSFDVERGSADWRGNLNIDTLSPSGTLSINELCITDKPLSAVFLVSSLRNYITIFAETVSFGDTDLQAVDTVIRKDPDGAQITLQAILFNISESFDDDVSISRVGANLAFNNPENGERDVQISINLDAFPLADLLEIAGTIKTIPESPPIIKNMERNIVMTSEIFASYDYQHIVYNIPHFIVASRGSGGTWANTAIFGTDENLSLNDGSLVTKNGIVNFSIHADYANPDNILFSSDVFWMNTTYLVQGAILDKHNISISSPQGISASLNFGSKNSFAGFVLLDTLQIPFGNQALVIDAVSDFRYDSLDSWAFNLDKLTFNSFSSTFLTNASAEFEAHADQDGANVNRIFFDDGRGPLFGQASLTWDRIIDEESSDQRTMYANIAGNASLRDLDNNETVSLELQADRNSLFAWAQAVEFQIGRILPNINFTLSGDLGFFKNPNETWSCAFDLTKLNGRLGETGIDIITHGSLDEDHLELSGTTIQIGQVLTEIPALLFSLDKSNFSTNATVSGIAANKPLYADLVLDAEFGQISSWFKIGSVLKTFTGTLSFQNVSYDTIKFDEAFTMEFSRQANIMSLNGGPQNMARAQMDAAGNFFAALSTPSPIQGTMLGVIKDNTIDARVSNLLVDISGLWRYVPVRAVNFQGGFILADIQVQGPLNDPDFFGTAQASSLRFYLPDYVNGELGPTPAFVRMTGSEMNLEPVVTRVGDGAAQIQASFRFDRWLPREFELTIDVPSDTPIPISIDVAGFNAHGGTIGTLTLEKTDENLSISGKITCDDAELTMSRGSDEETPPTADPNNGTPKKKKPVQLDLSITSGKKFEFLWPNANFPIIRANASAGSQITIESDTATNSFSMTGDVGIRNGEVFYFQRSFYIREGNIHFNESEINFDPHLTIRAEARDRTSTEAVTISMIIEDQGIKDFTPRLESSPPLSQVEILSLMGEKLAGTSGNENDTNPMNQFLVSATVDMLAQFYAVRHFERLLRDFFHADMFSFRTQALQNYIMLNVFQDVPANTNTANNMIDTPDTVTSAPGFGNYFDNTTVFFGKYIGTSLFFQGMVSVRYDANRTELNGFWFEPDLSLEFKAPFFDIRWDLAPKTPDWPPADLWIPDNQITISKKWTLP